MSIAEKFFGTRVDESDLGAIVVRDRRAATLFIVGTFPVHTVYTDTTVHSQYINTVHLVRSREAAAQLVGPHVDGYTLPEALDAIFDQDNGEGVGSIYVCNVFDPAVHLDGATPDPAQITNLDVLGEFDAAGTPSGLKLAYAIYNGFGVFPKFIAAPGLTGLTGVEAEIEQICEQLNSRAYIDMPLGVTVTQAINARGPSGDFSAQSNSERITYVYPFCEVADLANEGQTKPQWLSPRVYGIHLATIMTNGYHWPPSNKPVRGIVQMAQQLIITPGSTADDVQELRRVGILTVSEEFGKGPHTRGTRSAAYAAGNNVRDQIAWRFTLDMINEAVMFFIREFEDIPFNPATLAEIEARVNAWLGARSAGDDPVILGASFQFDRELTTVDEVANGNWYFSLRVGNTPIGETLVINSRVDLSFIADPLGLSSTGVGGFDTSDSFQ